MKKENSECTHIVFGFEHYNPLGIIRSLGEEGIRPIGIFVKNKLKLASKSKYLSKKYYVNDIQEGYDLLFKIYDELANKDKVFLYTSDDQATSFFDSHYNELKGKFIFFNAGSKNGITKYMDKNNINQLAIECGLNVAKTWVVKPGEIPKDIKYPIITKAIISTIDNWKKDSFICNNEEELKEAYKSIRSKKILLQQFINKKNELCIDGYSVNNGNDVFYAIASNYTYLLKEGYSYAMTVKNIDDEKLKKKLSLMFKKIKFEGIFSIEFLIDENDDLYFLEINFRNSTWSYASTVAGMNLPVLWHQAMLDNSIVKKSYKKFEPFEAIVEFADYRTRIKKKMIKFSDWRKELSNAKCLYYYNKKDKKPFISQIVYMVKGKIIK